MSILLTRRRSHSVFATIRLSQRWSAGAWTPQPIIITILAAFRVIVKEVLQGFFPSNSEETRRLFYRRQSVCSSFTNHAIPRVFWVWYGVILLVLRVLGQGKGNPNAVLANRIIKCIYAVFLANKIIRCIYLCSCVFMCRFRRDLKPVRDG